MSSSVRTAIADNAAPVMPRPARREAVAMSYDAAHDAPRIVAKGYGNVADAIIRCAGENALYVHESPELVGLLMQLEVDMQIPPALYVAVAELLGWLYSVESTRTEES
jgi:flagellar biosynthesis protein